MLSGQPSTRRSIGVSLATKPSRVDVPYSTTATILSFTLMRVQMHRWGSVFVLSHGQMLNSWETVCNISDVYATVIELRIL